MNTVGGNDRRPDAGSVPRFSIFSQFIIPNHINQNVSGVWESSLEELLSLALVGAEGSVAGGWGESKSGARGKVTVRNTVSRRCEELLPDADSVVTGWRSARSGCACRHARAEGTIRACDRERGRERENRQEEGKKEIRESNQEGLVNPTHTHTCTSRMNPQESDGGERQYEAQM